MSKPPRQRPPAAPRAAESKPDRASREAAALRANLRKRKAQALARKAAQRKE